METLLTTYRGQQADLITPGSIAVVDAKGQLVKAWGDPEEVAFPRSSCKLLQLLAALRLDIHYRYNFTWPELALMCGSHTGEPYHIQRILGLLEKLGLEESDLQCGAHYPLDKRTRQAMQARGEKPRAVHNNCSGKHCAMLASAKVLGADLSTYQLPDHPVQRNITQTISEICDLPTSEMKFAVDGCGVPVHALPLKAFAYGMARFARPKTLPNDLAKHAQLITQALIEQPFYASGTNRLERHIIRRFPGEVIVKSGANGYFAGYLPKLGLGFALKTYDGLNGPRDIILLELLWRLGLIKRKRDYAALLEYTPKIIKNRRGEIVGQRLCNL